MIDTGFNVVVNSGTLEATGTGGLIVNSAVDNSGLLWANGGNVTINGAVTGDGSASLVGSATLAFGAAASTDVTFDASAAGTLKLDDSIDFSGSIAGFNGDDNLDLLDIGFGANTSVSYVANQDGTGGTLNVTDGTHTANIALLGQYSAGAFEIAADGGTGTLIKYNDLFHP